MYVEIPKLSRCCFCCPLRSGIITFGYLNVIISVLVIACMVLTIELKQSTIATVSQLDVAGSASLLCILGIVVIINVVLVVGGHQRDLLMLRLYNYYTTAMVVAAFIPIAILSYRLHLIQLCAGLVAICMQLYLIILVRSEVIKMEHQDSRTEISENNTSEEVEILPDETII